MTVPARVSLVTLGVADVRRATAFYSALGWRVSAASVPGEVTFFHTQGGLLGVYGHSALAEDAGLAPEAPSAFRGMSVSINVETRENVDEALAEAVAAGGTITQPARATDWGGYTGYFSDPDGHLWEVAHNPGFPIGDDGRPTLP